MGGCAEVGCCGMLLRASSSLLLQVTLDAQAEDITFKLLGWSIRYMMIFKDNYLGSFTQFSTLYEYLDRRRNGLPVGDPVMQKYRVGKVRGFLGSHSGSDE